MKFSLSVSRKRLALSGIAAAGAFLATNPQPAHAQGIYSFTVDPAQTLSIATSQAASSETTATSTSAMDTLSMIGLDTKYTVTEIIIYNGNENLYSTQTINGSDSAGVNFSATLNLFYSTSTSALTTTPLVASAVTNVNPVKTANDTYALLTNQTAVTLTSAAAISAYVTEGTTGNHAAVTNDYNIVDTNLCIALNDSACEGSSVSSFQPFIYINYYLAGGVPGPSSAAVFLPGLSAGLLLLRRRRRACIGGADCHGPPFRE